MTELFGRLFPAVREIRNPLAVGYAWMLLIWLCGSRVASDRLAEDPVIELYDETLRQLPDLVTVSLLTFLAVMLGSGLVRLMDRVMQAIRFRRGTTSNPLDKDRQAIVGTYIAQKAPTERSSQEWGGPETDRSLFDDDLRMFLFYLQQDQTFGAHQSEQLLRFSLIPPVTVAVVLATTWWAFDPSVGVGLAIVALFVVLVVLTLDYLRIGSLLEARWKSLADEFPTWLPDEALARRNQRHVRVRAILDSDAGLRSFSGIASGDPNSNRTRIAGLRNSVTELRANGAPELAQALANAIPEQPDQDVDQDAAREFLDLASRWNGVWKVAEGDQTEDPEPNLPPPTKTEPNS